MDGILVRVGEGRPARFYKAVLSSFALFTAQREMNSLCSAFGEVERIG